MPKITSPLEGLNVTTWVGPLELKFVDSVAEVYELSDAHRAYLLAAGYKVGKKTADAPASTDGGPLQEPPHVDARDVSHQQVGTRLRDAAVDPRPEDFLPPTNAGEADPHGPAVVAPEIHASQGVRPVKGGDVHADEPATQEKLETEHAEQATSGEPIVALAVPAGNASADDWRAYAIASGATPEEVADLGRNDLRDRYTPKA